MNKGQKIFGYIVLLFLTVAIFFAGFFVNGCDSFQKKTYTKKGTKENILELCYKAQIDKKEGGGNLLHCIDLMDDVTTAGKQKNFQKCFEYYSTNKKKIKELYPEFDCYKNIYGNDK